MHRPHLSAYLHIEETPGRRLKGAKQLPQNAQLQTHSDCAHRAPYSRHSPTSLSTFREQWTRHPAMDPLLNLMPQVGFGILSSVGGRLAQAQDVFENALQKNGYLVLAKIYRPRMHRQSRSSAH